MCRKKDRGDGCFQLRKRPTDWGQQTIRGGQMTHKPKGLDKTDSQSGRVCVAALTWGMPSQSSASCMASVAFSTGFTGSQVSQSGHSPTKDTQINSVRHCWAGLNGRKTTPGTWCTAVNQCSQCFAVAPVPAKVGDWKIRNFVLDPAQ